MISLKMRLKKEIKQHLIKDKNNMLKIRIRKIRIKSVILKRKNYIFEFTFLNSYCQ